MQFNKEIFAGSIVKTNSSKPNKNNRLEFIQKMSNNLKKKKDVNNNKYHKQIICNHRIIPSNQSFTKDLKKPPEN